MINLSPMLVTLLLFSIVFNGMHSAIIQSRKVNDGVVYPEIQNLQSGHKRVIIRDLEDEVDLTVIPARRSIADDFTLIKYENGKMINSGNIDRTKRKLFRNREKQAVLRIDDEGPLTIRGFVNGNLKIDPHESRRMTKDGRMAHRISRVTRKEKNYFEDFVVIIPTEKRQIESALKKREEDEQSKEDECYAVEIALVTDHTIDEYLQGEDELRNYFALQFVAVQNMIDTLELNITVRLKGIISYTKESEPAFIKECIKSNSSYDSIIFFEYKYYHKALDIPLINDADGVFFVTRYGFGMKAFGMSYLAGLCDDAYRFAIARITDDFIDSATTFAHEIGHLLNVDHDGEGTSKDCPEGKYIMASHNEITDYYSVFSPCNQKIVTEFKRSLGPRCIVEKCNRTSIEEYS